MFVAIALVAVLAPLVAPQDPYAQHLTARLLPPVWMAGGDRGHLLGTDALGHDVLSRLVHGARISLLIGGVATLLSALIGITLGTIGGYFRGRVDMAVNFLITVRLTLPVVIVALALVARLGGSLPVVVLVIGALLSGPIRGGGTRHNAAAARPPIHSRGRGDGRRRGAHHPA